MSAYFVSRARNYFVLVLNSLKPFCLSSEQGLMENFIFCAVLVNQSLRLTQAIQFLCSLHYPSLSSYNKNDWLLTQLNNFQNCNFMLLLFGHIFKLRRSTVIKCSYIWRYISNTNSNCQIFLCNNFRNMAVFSRRSRLK